MDERWIELSALRPKRRSRSGCNGSSNSAQVVSRLDRQLFLALALAADQSRAFACQPQIPIGWQILKRLKMRLRRRLIGHFKNRRPLIDLVKHRDIRHVEAHLGCGVKLPPEKLPAEARNGR